MKQAFDGNVEARIRQYDRLAWVLTIAVWLLVGLMRRVKIPVSVDLGFLAGLNAIFNTGVAIALLLAYYFIRQKQVSRHRRSIYAAMLLSAGFLLSYVGYHFTQPEVPYCGEGAWKSVYYFLLFSHILLAGLSLPFILKTFIRGYLLAVDRHRPLARWVYWIWLYVALTGPLVYLFLLPCR